MLSVSSYRELTNSFIMEMPDELYETTKAHTQYGEKYNFCEKITDKFVRYMMLKSCVCIDAKNIYDKILTQTQ